MLCTAIYASCTTLCPVHPIIDDPRHRIPTMTSGLYGESCDHWVLEVRSASSSYPFINVCQSAHAGTQLGLEQVDDRRRWSPNTLSSSIDAISGRESFSRLGLSSQHRGGCSSLQDIQSKACIADGSVVVSAANQPSSIAEMPRREASKRSLCIDRDASRQRGVMASGSIISSNLVI